MFMENIHGLEVNIIKVSSLLNLIYKSNAVQMTMKTQQPKTYGMQQKQF